MRLTLKSDGAGMISQSMPALLRKITEGSNITDVSHSNDTDPFDFDREHKLTRSSSFGVALRTSVTSSVSDISMSATFRSTDFLEETNAALEEAQTKDNADKKPTRPGRRISTFVTSDTGSSETKSEEDSVSTSDVVTSPPTTTLEGRDKERTGRRVGYEDQRKVQSANSVLKAVRPKDDDASRQDSIDSETLMDMIIVRNNNAVAVEQDTKPSQPGRKVSMAIAITEATTDIEKLTLEKQPKVCVTNVPVHAKEADTKPSIPGRKISVGSSTLESVNDRDVLEPVSDSKPIVPGRKESISSQDISHADMSISSKRDIGSVAEESYSSKNANIGLPPVTENCKSGKSQRFSIRYPIRKGPSNKEKQEQEQESMRNSDANKSASARFARSPPTTRSLPKRSLRGLMATPTARNARSTPTTRSLPTRNRRGLLGTMLNGSRRGIARGNIDANLETPDLSCLSPPTVESKKKRFSILRKPNNLDTPDLSCMDATTPLSSAGSKKKRFSIMRKPNNLEAPDLSCMDSATESRKKRFSILRPTANLETSDLPGGSDHSNHRKKRFSILRKN